MSETTEKYSAVGNAAKMREALELASRVIHCAIAADILKGDDAQTAFFACRAALSAPPRNCDLPTVTSDTHRAWLDDEDNWDEFGNPRLEIHEWLVSPAKKGDNNGNE